jgi:hypothetical protein
MSFMNFQPIDNLLVEHNKKFPGFYVVIKKFAYRDVAFPHSVIGVCKGCKDHKFLSCYINHNSIFELIFEIAVWNYDYSTDSPKIFKFSDSNLNSFRGLLQILNIPYINQSANEVPSSFSRIPVVNPGVSLLQLEREDEHSSIVHKVKTSCYKKSKTCSRRLKAGKRKGETCEKPVYKRGMCYRHDHLKNWYIK